MTRREWFGYWLTLGLGALIAIPIGVAAGGLTLWALGVDVRWWWER